VTAAALARHFRIPDAILNAAGVRDVTDAETRDLLGQHGYQGCDLAGVVFTYRHPLTGAVVGHRVRLNRPPTGGGKYLAEPGCRWLFVAPVPNEWLAETGVPVVLVEAEKSALALLAVAERAGRELLPIATGGCWGLRRNDGYRDLPDGGREPVTAPSPTLDRLAWAGREAIIAFDANAAANPKVRRARRELAEELAGRGASVRIAEVPALKSINGPDDLIAVSGDEAALDMLDTARPFAECALAEAEAEVSSLEKLPDSDAKRKADAGSAIEAVAAVGDELRRASFIARLGAVKPAGFSKAEILKRVGMARTGAANARQLAAEAARRGRLLSADVDGAALLVELELFFTERACLPKGAAIALALWALFTWAVDAFGTAPYICLESAIPGCGKSTVLDLLEVVCARAEQSAGLTKALLARTIEKTKATMLFDQAEALRDKKDESGLVSVLLSGYRRGKPYRCLVGDEHEPGEFSVFGPKAFCAVGGLGGALLDRCLVLHMEKKPAQVELESAESEDLAPIAEPLRERMEAFALKAAPALEAVKANRPKGGHWPQFSNRERQLWTPLLSIARVCGPEAERRAVAAAELLAGRKAQAQADNPRAAKVVALAEVLAELKAEKFSPKDLVKALAETEAWGESLAEKHRKDNTGKAAANLVGHFLRDFRLESRERQRAGTLYSTAEALAKAEQHMPHTPQTTATSATSATRSMNTRGFGVADAVKFETASATRPIPSATRAVSWPMPNGAAVADARTPVADAERDFARSATLETPANHGVVADVADVAGKPGVQTPSQSGLFAGPSEREHCDL